VTQQQMIPDTKHNNIQIGRGYWESITAFLDSMLED